MKTDIYQGSRYALLFLAQVTLLVGRASGLYKLPWDISTLEKSHFVPCLVTSLGVKKHKTIANLDAPPSVLKLKLVKNI